MVLRVPSQRHVTATRRIAVPTARRALGIWPRIGGHVHREQQRRPCGSVAIRASCSGSTAIRPAASASYNPPCPRRNSAHSDSATSELTGPSAHSTASASSNNASAGSGSAGSGRTRGETATTARWLRRRLGLLDCSSRPLLGSGCSWSNDMIPQRPSSHPNHNRRVTKEKPERWTRWRAFAQVRHSSNIQLLPSSLVNHKLTGLVGDHDQVAAGVIEDRGGHRPHLPRLLGEPHAERSQPLVLLVNVVDGE
jgi:hypothetical protein